MAHNILYKILNMYFTLQQSKLQYFLNIHTFVSLFLLKSYKCRGKWEQNQKFVSKKGIIVQQIPASDNIQSFYSFMFHNW